MSEVERYWIDASRLIQEGWHQDDTEVVQAWAYDRVTAERDALQQRLTASEGEQLACMPVERCYDVRAKMIIAFNEAKKEGGDLHDALDAAYKSALRYSPNPLSAEQPAPVAVMLPAQRNSADGRHDERVEGYNEALADVRREISFSAKQL